MMPCQLGLESGLGLENRTETEMNYHLESQGASDENCKSKDLLIIVIG